MRLNQVTLSAFDMEASIQFYQSLGLHLIVDARPKYVRFENLSDSSTLSLHQVAGGAVTNGAIIYFECEDLDRRVAELQNRGLTFLSGPQDESWLWREARLQDPAGNVIVLYFAGVNRLNPPWRV